MNIKILYKRVPASVEDLSDSFASILVDNNGFNLKPWLVIVNIISCIKDLSGFFTIGL
jgi:hypothetical protein